jgi:hypothetical protein
MRQTVEQRLCQRLKWSVLPGANPFPRRDWKKIPGALQKLPAGTCGKRKTESGAESLWAAFQVS